MCLTSVIPDLRIVNQYGYKVFVKKYNGNMSGIYYNHNHKYQLNTWYKSKQVCLTDNSLTGFCIF